MSEDSSETISSTDKGTTISDKTILTKKQKKQIENIRRAEVEKNYKEDSQILIQSGISLEKQGNPIDEYGNFIVEKLNSGTEISDKDFERPYRNVELPSLDSNVDAKVRGNGRKVLIKRDVFLKNNLSHPEINIKKLFKF